MAKIIAVDDSLADLKLVASILGGVSHNVVLCVNGDGVEEIAQRENPDLILLDVVMPNRNGYEILRKLRRIAETKDIPVCIVSSKQEASDIEWGKRQGANGYLPKPYTPDDLIQTVASLTTK
jgi:CheY-like chemotaxis protein